MKQTFDSNKFKVITESTTDSMIVEAILPDAIKNRIQIIECDGRDSALLMARSILASVHRQKPLLLVAGSHTHNSYLIASQRELIDSSLFTQGQIIANESSIFPPSSPNADYVLACPAIEIMLVPFLLKEKNYSPLEQEFAKSDPERFILAGRKEKEYQGILQGILDRLDEKTLEEIRKTSFASLIIDAF